MVIVIRTVYIGDFGGRVYDTETKYLKSHKYVVEISVERRTSVIDHVC